MIVVTGANGQTPRKPKLKCLIRIGRNVRCRRQSTTGVGRNRPKPCLTDSGALSILPREVALAEALRLGHLAGAALDPYEWEPQRLLGPQRRVALDDPTRNILLTPHGVIAWRAEDYGPSLRFLRGEPLANRLV
jgi:hypothetical protein